MERIDDLQYKGLKIIQNTEGFCFGIDSVLLTEFAKDMKKNKTIVDLGTGTGIIGILLTKKVEASKVIEMGLRGEKIPTVMSSKVRRYVRKVLILNKNDSTKSIAKKMQQDLTVKIIERNKETTNVAEAKKLYHALMNEQ